jgi:Ca2+/H+ antiporter
MDFAQRILNTTHYAADLHFESEEEMMERFLLEFPYVRPVPLELHFKIIIVSVFLCVVFFKLLTHQEVQEALVNQQEHEDEELEDQRGLEDQEEFEVFGEEDEEDQIERPAEILAGSIKDWSVYMALLILALSK